MFYIQKAPKPSPALTQKRQRDTLAQIEAIVKEYHAAMPDIVGEEVMGFHKIRWSNRTHFFAAFDYDVQYTKDLVLSKVLLGIHPDDRELLRTLVAHELLHTIPDCQNHKKKWKACAEKVNRAWGMKIGRGDMDGILDKLMIDKIPVPFWKIVCRNCGAAYYACVLPQCATDCGVCGGLDYDALGTYNAY